MNRPGGARGTDRPGRDGQPNDAELMGGPAFESALDAAIARLRAGESPEQCAAAFPEFSAHLRPLLEVAALAHRLAPAPDVAAARARVRGRIMTAAAARQASRPWWARLGLGAIVGPGWGGSGGWRPAALAAAAAAALIAFGGGGALVASAGALPGDAPYPIKLAGEEARATLLRVAADEAAQAALQSELATRRLDEAKALAERGRAVPPGLVEAAAKHASSAERLVAQLPEPKRAQVAAALADDESQRAATLSGLLERGVPPPAATAISNALDRGRAHAPGQAERERGGRGPGDGRPGGPRADGPPGVARGGDGAGAAQAMPAQTAGEPTAAPPGDAERSGPPRGVGAGPQGEPPGQSGQEAGGPGRPLAPPGPAGQDGPGGANGRGRGPENRPGGGRGGAPASVGASGVTAAAPQSKDPLAPTPSSVIGPTSRR